MPGILVEQLRCQGVLNLRPALVSLPLVISALGFVGCHPARPDSNGVIGVFGGVGLGPGEFSYPRGIAIGPDLAVYVVDKAARIQRFLADGQPQLEWRMPDKEAGKPVGMTVHTDGRVFVADTHYHRVMVFDREGRELARFGKMGMGDGEFQLVTDVAVDADGFIYVSEYSGNDRISKWSPEFKFVTAFGMEAIDGVRMSRPDALAIDEEQTLWVADACNHRIIRFGLDGRVISWFGKMGRDPGEMRYPYDVACAKDGRILVCEYGNHRLQWFDREGRSLGTWGGEGRERGRLWSPWDAAIAPNGNIYVVDSYNSRVQIIRP